MYLDGFTYIWHIQKSYTFHEGKNSQTGCTLTTVTEYNFESNRMLPVLGESKHANHIEFVWICTSLTCPFAKCKGDMLVSYKPRLNDNTHPSPNNECCHTNAPQRQSSILLNFFTSRFLPNMLSRSFQFIYHGHIKIAFQHFGISMVTLRRTCTKLNYPDVWSFKMHVDSSKYHCRTHFPVKDFQLWKSRRVELGDFAM